MVRVIVGDCLQPRQVRRREVGRLCQVAKTLVSRQLAAVERHQTRSVIQLFQLLTNCDTLSRLTRENKKLRYREEHSASVVLSWCTSWHFSGENLLMANQPILRNWP